MYVDELTSYELSALVASIVLKGIEVAVVVKVKNVRDRKVTEKKYDGACPAAPVGPVGPTLTHAKHEGGTGEQTTQVIFNVRDFFFA